KPDQKKAIIEELRQRWGKFEGAKIKVKDFQQGMPMPAPVEVKILGDNLGTLRELAAQIEDSLKATPGTLYVHNPVKNHKSDIRVHINKAKAHSFGVPMVNIARAVRAAVSGLSVGTYTESGEKDTDYTVQLTVPRSAYPDLTIFS